MLPEIWIFDTYSVMILIGVIACFILLNVYGKKRRLNEKYIYDIMICGCVSIAIGLGSAALFQIVFDMLKDATSIRFGAMTFYGGLIGGIIAFILIYQFWVKKFYPENTLSDLLPIAPACITVAHGFGRIGCFMAGCCYGKETSSFLGVTFPGMTTPVYPTQLFEAFFLLILTIPLFILAYKKFFKYNMCIYLLSYGIFRFLLEFLRGDNRGVTFLLSPSQWISIIAIIASIILFFKLKTKNNI